MGSIREVETAWGLRRPRKTTLREEGVKWFSQAKARVVRLETVPLDVVVRAHVRNELPYSSVPLERMRTLDPVPGTCTEASHDHLDLSRTLAETVGKLPSLGYVAAAWQLPAQRSASPRGDTRLYKAVQFGEALPKEALSDKVNKNNACPKKQDAQQIRTSRTWHCRCNSGARPR